MICVFIIWREHPKAHRKWFYVVLWAFMEKPGIEPATPGLQGIALIHYTTGLLKTFCGFPWVETSTAGRVYDLCVYYMTGAPEGSPKVVLCGFMVFMEKPGIEPATPGLQGIALIHYTTGASQYKRTVGGKYANEGNPHSFA